MAAALSGWVKWMTVVVILLAVYVTYSNIGHTSTVDLTGMRVLVTGASTGIGEQIAYRYAEQGASVVITARTEHRLKRVVDRCTELGRKDQIFSYFVVDMANVNAPKTVIEFADRELGGLDVLVLNHMYIMRSANVWAGSADNLTMLRHVMDVNFHSYVQLTSHALPILEQSNGSLVVISSLSAKMYQPYFLAYVSSKFALTGFFGGLRLELEMRRSGVSVTICFLGFIGTENAVTSLKQFGLNRVLTVEPTDPKETAQKIVAGAVARTKDVYFPYLQTRLTPLIREFFPDVFDFYIRYLYTKS
ncbi:Hydroxysteroid 11-beta-dehydrogenase 1-like protein [Lamellibrachia satsuma]|nr:Hydroxysteroid 11-beta-dehydrogenase 1-like protein [Lamellibrachia satsuma]